MNYVVNDIENMLLLDSIGVFSHICHGCNSISITNIRINDFSIQMQRKIQTLINKYENFIEVDLDLDFYIFEKNLNSVLTELGDGDRSSLYFAKTKNEIIITNSILINNTANKLNLKVVYTADFMKQFIIEKSIVDYFNNFKIA